ncbi:MULTISPECIES: phospholipase D-like domain-containing protein [unclassified Haematobacter]|uniref:phospholipase D-like domain-containing protein n=1 Tax=unclassified Haematobacter TaxID=2640585 RepID=UPI0025B9B6DE|nr:MULTISPECIES: phosphatidylserine/phosphatidylglycerophosphate/cardiolipin synthase family protein [unclassified Haematobacter]
MHWLIWLSLIVAVAVGASLFALWSFGRFARRASGPDSHALPRTVRPSPFDTVLDPLETAHPGMSGGALLFCGQDAFAARFESIRRATRSIDLQYYIWKDDITGNLLAGELLTAADRGVRIRILLDDVNVLGIDPKWLNLNGHPRVEMRIFNPIVNRQSALRRGIEMALALVRYNRRMHTKSWTVDGRISIIGGRNIGDSYFDAARRRRRNSLDADMLLAGPVVAEVETMFDAYWNSDLALPLSALWSERINDLVSFRRRIGALRRHRRGREYLSHALKGDDALPGLDRLVWSDTFRIVTDPPEKARGEKREEWLPTHLGRLINQAEQRFEMITPYLVPGKPGMAQLGELRERGVEVRLLTNALATTDHSIVHGAYRRYRVPLLTDGVELHEYAPTDEGARRGRMLHAKTFVIDRRTAFIGSFNYDLRSAFLNTEVGVVFEAPELVGALCDWQDAAMAPQNAFHLSLHGRWIRWDQSLEGQDASQLPEIWYEPKASPARRALSWIVGHLPIHSYL